MSNPIDKRALYDQIMKLLDEVERIQPAPGAPPPPMTLTDAERELCSKMNVPEDRALAYKIQRAGGSPDDQ